MSPEQGAPQAGEVDVASRRSRRSRVWSAEHVFLALALLLMLPALAPLAAPGYFFAAHDAHHTVFFLVELDQAVRDGVLWPIWGPDLALGFGYPLWLLYAPLAYMVAEAVHLVGLGLTAAIKLTWALAFVLGALGTYRLARRWWSPSAGLVASLTFTYAPYHLAQIYVRGALAEFFALAWVPWVLLSFVELWADPRPRRAAIAALLLGALLLTHTVSTLLFAPVIGGYLLLRWAMVGAAGRSAEPRRRWRAATAWSVAALVLGASLACIFVLPMLLERGYIEEAQWVHATYDYRNHFVYLSQFFDTRFGSGYSVPGARDGMSFQLGLLPSLGGLLGALALWHGWSRRGPLGHVPDSSAEVAFFLAVLGVSLFAMTPASSGAWDALPLVALVQFPWRLLAVTSLALALLSGAGIQWLESRHGSGTGGGLTFLWVIMIAASSLAFVQPELSAITPTDESPAAVIDFETRFPDMRGMTVWSERLPRDEDSPLLAQYKAGEPLQRLTITDGQGEILAQRAGAASVQATIRAESAVRLRIYTYYFPGWQAWVDDQPVELQIDPPNGLMSLSVPPGEHELRLRFGATRPRSVGAAISGLALAATLVLWSRARIRRSPSPTRSAD